MAPKHIKILPELAAWFRNLNEAEAAKLEENLKRDGLLDTLKWAEITMPDGEVVETIVDGHQRWLACQRLRIEIPDEKWELIEGVTTIRSARKWMYDFQAGRRNWSPNEVALMAAQEYEDDKIASGERTDLSGKDAIDTAEKVGARFGKTGRWVRDAVQFAKAVRTLSNTIGIDAQTELLQDAPPINRDTVVALSQAPEHIQREAWDLVMKRNTRGIPAILEKAKKHIEGVDSKSLPGGAGVKSAASRFDLGELVQLIDSWSEEMIRAYNPITNTRASSYLTAHLSGALRKLIILAECNGLAGDVLDGYPVRAAAAKDVTPAEPEQPAPEAEPGSAKLDLDAVRSRMRTKLEYEGLTVAALSRQIGVGQNVVTDFLSGGKPYAKTAAKYAVWMAGE
jgi:hypothetical protein